VINAAQSASDAVPAVADSLLFAYAVLALGLASTPVLKATGRYGDLSYGLYLYAFPMQQASYQIFRGGFWLPLFTAAGAAACCAYVSWRLVERRALQMKPPPCKLAEEQRYKRSCFRFGLVRGVKKIGERLSNELRVWSRLAIGRPPAENG